MPDKTLTIGILIVAHKGLGEGMAGAVAHVLGHPPQRFEVLSVPAEEDPSSLLTTAKAMVDRLDDGHGVMVFSDIFGASPCNLACKLLEAGRVEGIAGVNLPMLVRAITYRHGDLEAMVKKAVSGGCEGVLHIEPPHAPTRH